MESKLVRVTFEFEDGTKKYIINEELGKWQTYNTIVAFEAERHGINPNWEAIKWIKQGQDINY